MLEKNYLKAVIPTLASLVMPGCSPSSDSGDRSSYDVAPLKMSLEKVLAEPHRFIGTKLSVEGVVISRVQGIGHQVESRCDYPIFNGKSVTTESRTAISCFQEFWFVLGASSDSEVGLLIHSRTPPSEEQLRVEGTLVRRGTELLLDWEQRDWPPVHTLSPVEPYTVELVHPPMLYDVVPRASDDIILAELQVGDEIAVLGKPQFLGVTAREACFHWEFEGFTDYAGLRGTIGQRESHPDQGSSVSLTSQIVLMEYWYVFNGPDKEPIYVNSKAPLGANWPYVLGAWWNDPASEMHFIRVP